MKFASLNRVPAYVELADEITNQIVDGRLQSGQFLPTEQELADSFNINRSTLREGLRVLEQRGLVERKGKMLRIKKPSQQLIANTVGRALVLHEVTFQDIYFVGMLLIPAAAELAATHIDEPGKAELKDVLAGAEQLIDDPDAMSLIDIKFFRLVAQASGNIALNLSLAPLGLIFFSAFHLILKKVPIAAERMLESHRQVCDAICRGDSMTAGHWMRRNVEDFRRGCESAGIPFDSRIQLHEDVMSSLGHSSGS